MNPTVLSTKAELRQYLEQSAKRRRLSVVPTMGALHRGHQSLIGAGREHADEVLVTVFVNPTQFGPGEDFDRYPRTWERDLERCEEAGATAVFRPSKHEMYPAGEETRVVVGALGSRLCGASRPGHFTGVLTIVAKLMHLCGPSSFVFGRKDFQQLRVIQRMVADLFLPINIVEHPIVREGDGLALSSRNAYLSAEQRIQALAIPRALALSHRAHAEGRAPEELVSLVRSRLQDARLELDYVEALDAESLQPLSTEEQPKGHVLLAVAAFCGRTRLIDNLVLGVDAAPTVAE